jgi:hypothetical protein
MSMLARNSGKLVLATLLVVIAVVSFGCGGGTTTDNGGSGKGGISPNDSLTTIQVGRFRDPGTSGYLMTMDVYIVNTTDVPGFENLVKSKLDSTITVVTNQDMFAFERTLGSYFQGNIKQAAHPENGTVYVISNIQMVEKPYQ